MMRGSRLVNSGWLRTALCVTVLAITSANAGAAESLQVCRLFADHAVVQRAEPIRVWGQSAAGAEVRVDMDPGPEATTQADSGGQWAVELEPMTKPLDQPLTLSVTSGDEAFTAEDLRLGEVWFLAGEGELCAPVSQNEAAPKAAGDGNAGALRVFVIEPAASDKPVADVAGHWTAASDGGFGGVPALAALYAEQVSAVTGTPVGVVVAALPRAPIEAWICEEALRTEPLAEEILTFWQVHGWRDPGDPNAPIPADGARSMARPEDVAFWRPGAVWRGMVEPVAGLTMRGVVWRHGETNVSRAWQYGSLLACLVEDWRKAWGRSAPGMPFLVAGLPGRHVASPDGRTERLSPDAVAELRESQLLLRRVWRSTPFTGRARVAFDNGVMSLPTGNDMTGITWDGPLWRMNYEITLQARRVEGTDFFCGLTFPVEYDSCSLIVGGWGGQIVGLSSLDHMDAANNETTRFMQFENDRWYDIKLQVVPGRIQAWIDGEEVVNALTEGRKIGIRWEVERSRPLGVSTWRTGGEIREVRQARLTEHEPRAVLQERRLRGLAPLEYGLVNAVDLGPLDGLPELARRLALAASELAYDKTDVSWSGPIFEAASFDDKQATLDFRAVGSWFPESKTAFPVFEVMTRPFRWEPAGGLPERQRIRVTLPEGVDPLAVRYLWTDAPPAEAIIRDGKGLPVHGFRTGDRDCQTAGMLVPVSITAPAQEERSSP